MKLRTWAATRQRNSVSEIAARNFGCNFIGDFYDDGKLLRLHNDLVAYDVAVKGFGLEHLQYRRYRHQTADHRKDNSALIVTEMHGTQN